MIGCRLFRWCVVPLMLLAVSSSPQAYAQSKPGAASVRLVLPPLTNYSGLLVAREKGWFEAENLNVTWSTVTQTAVSIEAVYGGSAEFGAGGILEPMIARGNGFDLMFAVPTAKINRQPPDNSALVVRSSGDIKRPARSGRQESLRGAHQQHQLHPHDRVAAPKRR